ncbi:sister chromatid cohesion protein Pds5p [[Candida] jaroonii]|uniref:Sister chromatid cohesion protein Pds5p n=1 Tax=[Candida] jaroonii TaxID=467808 RepID=A0ACA9YCD9_9ASCO|nr:sister chromatid cohesion protein Pds5p [[Candida] jaroonii]
MSGTVEEGTKTLLTFNKPIVSTPSNPIGTKDLLIRLQQLSDELTAIDQDAIDLKTLDTIKKDLISHKLLRSNNPGVQAYVCCAISDLLRIYAPDAPFTSSDLSLIFRSFLQQFKRLADSNNPYFHQQCYLLKRLAEVRSAILITDLKDSEELMESVFNIFYELAKKEFPSRLEPFVSSILSDVMQEAEVVPHNVLKMILESLLTNNASSSLNIYNPAFNFSVSICDNNSDRMSRQVAQYFSEMLYETSSQIEDVNDSRNSNSIKAMESLKKIHKLSVEIWNYVPSLLTSVMGLIEEELNASDERIRVLATETIGKMIGSSISSQNFVVNFENVWQNWLKKTLDISTNVRCKWVEEVSNIVNNCATSSEISNELCNGLNKCLIDSDEKVRLVSCLAIEKIPFEKLTRFCNKNIMITLTQLMREKHQDIRSQAIKILGNQCNKYFDCLLNNEVIDFGSKNSEEVAQLEEEIFQKIPNQTLSLLYINDKDINAQVDICLFEKILPFENNDNKRVERLIQVFKCLDDKSKRSVFAINKRQQQVAKVLGNFVSLSEEYGKIGSLNDNKENLKEKASNGDKIAILTNKLDQIIKWLSETVPDSYNSMTCLERFYKLKNFRFLNLIKQIISSDSDFSTIKNSMKELMTKLSNNKNIRVEEDRASVTSNDMVSTFKLILYRGSNLMFNKSNLAELINYSKNALNEQDSTSSGFIANELLESISEINPDVFKNQVKGLLDIVNDQQTDQYLRSNCLKTIYRFVRVYPEMYPEDPEFTDNLFQLCVNGSPREAKYCIKLIGLCEPRKAFLCTELVGKLYPLDCNHEKFTTHLSALCEVFLVDPMAIEDKASDLTAQLIKDVLLVNRDIEEGDESKDSIIEDLELNTNYRKHQQLHGKILTIRLFINRLRSIDEDSKSTEEKLEVFQPILKLLLSIINNGGEIVKDRSTPKDYQSNLRLFAGLCILKLSRSNFFNGFFNNNVLMKLIYLLQDQNDKIRTKMLDKLQKKIGDQLLSDKFLTILYFMNNEPDNDIYFKVTTWIKSSYKKTDTNEDPVFERSLLRLIHLLSHDPNFADVDRETGLKYAAEIIIFFYNMIAKQENVSTLYYVASRVKQFRDGTIDSKIYDTLSANHELNETEEFPKEVENLYMISELSQLIIKESSDSKSWSILSWPGKIPMPNDLFSPMTTTFEAQMIISKVYINDDLQPKIKSFISQKFSKSAKSKPKAGIKRVRTKSSKPRKVNPPKKRKIEEVIEVSRKSSRSRKSVNYGEVEESDNESVDQESSSDDYD